MNNVGGLQICHFERSEESILDGIMITTSEMTMRAKQEFM